MPKPSKSSPNNRWSGRVTQENNAFDLEKEIFTWKDPKRLALSLKQSADSSTRLKSSPFRSAVSMLVFISTGPARTWTKTTCVFWSKPRKDCGRCMEKAIINNLTKCKA